MLSFVLSSPELKSISLFHCDALTDKVLEKAALLHQFRNLEILDFLDCDCVTKKGIDILLNESNPLRKLVVNRCEMITEQEFMEWLKKLEKKTWKLKLVFHWNHFPFPYLNFDSDLYFDGAKQLLLNNFIAVFCLGPSDCISRQQFWICGRPLSWFNIE